MMDKITIETSGIDIIRTKRGVRKIINSKNVR